MNEEERRSSCLRRESENQYYKRRASTQRPLILLQLELDLHQFQRFNQTVPMDWDPLKPAFTAHEFSQFDHYVEQEAIAISKLETGQVSALSHPIRTPSMGY
jgi:hypothetical protein